MYIQRSDFNEYVEQEGELEGANVIHLTSHKSFSLGPIWSG